MGLTNAAPNAVGGAYADVERFDHHNASLTGYNFLSLSLALGIVKRQSMVGIGETGNGETLT